MEFKKGQRVLIKSDYESGRNYGTNIQMRSMIGKLHIIDSIGSAIMIGGV